MQDIGGKEDTDLSGEDLTLNRRELSVESLGHCQSVGNWIAHPNGALPWVGVPLAGSKICLWQRSIEVAAVFPSR